MPTPESPALARRTTIFGNRALRILWIAAAPFLLPVSAQPERPRTFANPLNLEYRFMIDQPSRREAADPAIVLFGDDYYLFASKSGGYWHSRDLVDWKFVTSAGLPIEAYAPAVMVLDNALYYTACNIGLYKSTDPKSGKWEFVSQTFNVGDPDLFADDDGRVYLYYGLSYNGAISGMELDPKNHFKPIGEPFLCFRANFAQHGWERRGDDNLGAATGNLFQEGPWLEGSWMTKHAGTYYLQYAAPGTEFRTYSDGVYTAPTPRGPFTYAPSSPFSFKPSGFITGAGHSGTFADKEGRYWHIATMVISMKHQFERRLGLFPAGFDADGVLHMNTLFGDYPQVAPHDRKGDSVDTSAGWMLLSYGKKAQASSSLDTFGPEKAFDEDIKSYWSARTPNAGEWLSVDLGKTCRLEAVQVNFAEHESTTLGRSPELYHQYRLDASLDGKEWQPLADRSANRRDVPHDYVQLSAPASARYVRLTNVRVPGGGPFSVRDLRIFGSGEGKPPAAAPSFEVHRDVSDPRNAVVRWQMSRDAAGYIVRYGVAPGKLYQNYEVRGQKELAIHGLNAETDYYFTVDAFNDSGRTQGTQTQAAAHPGRK
ncbi:family 43 glycosylhydrolase [uncultured Paludibaculum sp.]|uniref:family 43 glycosylhydrolase n=1 Tax=uncultured Paludibaculum sp. TaxID=1765020 RepID=UPI002AAB2F4C|nr:family 43 glycosylhydrolase [uncultured Paludibaculum sp.]